GDDRTTSVRRLPPTGVRARAAASAVVTPTGSTAGDASSPGAAAGPARRLAHARGRTARLAPVAARAAGTALPARGRAAAPAHPRGRLLRRPADPAPQPRGDHRDRPAGPGRPAGAVVARLAP